MIFNTVVAFAAATSVCEATASRGHGHEYQHLPDGFSTLTTSQAASTAMTTSIVSVAVTVTTSLAAISSTPSTSPSSLKRGAAYNTASLVAPLLGSGSQITWGYNWDQVSRSLDASLEYVPQLWGTGSNFVANWTFNAAQAISDGSTSLLSFNEPDNTGQANLTVAEAVSAHIMYMNKFSGQAQIGTPAVTNSANEGEGASWLSEWVSVCAGQCKFDFCVTHWYNSANTEDFFQHATDIYTACGGNKPVWITEFQPQNASDSQISTFLESILTTVETNPTYSFIERIAYFMVTEGNLISTSSEASYYGVTYAYYVPS